MEIENTVRTRMLSCLCEIATAVTSAECAALFLREHSDVYLLASSDAAKGTQRADRWLYLLRQHQTDDALDGSAGQNTGALSGLSHPGLIVQETAWEEDDALSLSGDSDEGVVLLVAPSPDPKQSSVSRVTANAAQLVVLLRTIREVLDAQTDGSADRESELAEYLGALAHDLNNHFAVVLGYVHLLSEQSGNLDTIRRSIDVIREAMIAANGLVSPLLRSPQQAAADEVRIELDEWLRREAPAIVKRVSSTIALELDLSAPQAAVLVSPSGLRRTLRMVIHRLMEHEPPHSRLHVWTRTSGAERGDGSIGSPGEGAPVSTVRLGMQIVRNGPRDEWETIKTASQERKPTGSELPDFALPLARRFAGRYGGKLAVSDDPGTGRTAVLELPLIPIDPETTAATSNQPATSSPSRSSVTVLVIDDDKNIRDFIQQILLGQGYRVTCCGAGGEAGLLVSGGLNPDAIICDVVLPDGTGLDFMKQIAAPTPAPRWLFMSGYGVESLTGRGMLDPASPFLSKPFTPDELTSKLLELLLEREADRQRTVLVVDDDAGIRELLRQVLTGAGHHVLEAKDGKEALATLDHASIDLLLTDLVMPAVDGASLIKQARMQDLEVPIIAFSGSLAASERLALATTLGATAVVTKPIELQALIELINVCLRAE